MTVEIAGYQIIEQLHESGHSLVYRGHRLADNQPVVLKILKKEYATPEELARYRQEYELCISLQLERVVKAYSLEKYDKTLVISFEDFGATSLNVLQIKQIFDLENFLKLAIQITDALSGIHQQNIIHKDINPSNIVFNVKTEMLKIIDFGISTKLSRENPTIKNPNVLEGTLPYISPEQAGRMNRVLDYRTDFYSLGVTFYELVTSRLPFETKDVLELVHCHIAREAIPPHKLNPRIPPISMKEDQK